MKVSTVLRAGDMEAQRYRNEGADEDTIFVDRTGMRAWLTEGEAEALWAMLGALLGKAPVPDARRATVRMAVVVDECGDYGAVGASPAAYRSLEDDARDTEGAALIAYRDAVGEKSARRKHVVWVTASVPLPESVEVRGEVEA